MYIIGIENIETGALAALSVFSPVSVGTVIGWGTDDGVNTAQWKVTYCREV